MSNIETMPRILGDDRNAVVAPAPVAGAIQIIPKEEGRFMVLDLTTSPPREYPCSSLRDVVRWQKRHFSPKRRAAK